MKDQRTAIIDTAALLLGLSAALSGGLGGLGGLGGCTWWSDTGYRQDPGAAPVTEVQLATCRNQGAEGNACFPTLSEIGTSPVHPCREHSGKCGPVGGRTMCVLDRIADGKPCQGMAGTCTAGECVAAGAQRDGG